MVEERVRSCRECKAIIGWYALFCETCGAKQGREGEEPRVAPKPADGLEAEARRHVPSSMDAREVARSLFRAQLEIIHRHRERVESLIGDVEAIHRGLGAARSAPKSAVARTLDPLSERMYEAEQVWGEIQVSYNRQSEAIEEESRESMEVADMDAYLSPDENRSLEDEYAALTGRFEAVDALMRDAGREIALLRRGAASRYGQGGPPAGRMRWVLLALTLVLAGGGLGAAFFGYGSDPIRVAATVGPPLLALILWVGWAFRRA